MPTAKVPDKLPLVCGAAVDEQQHATPAPQGEFEKPDELRLPFVLVERVRKPPLGSGPEDIRADVLVVDEDGRVAAASRPAPRYDGDKAECCLVLCSDDEPSSPILPHQATRFFLNAAMVAASARR